MKMEKNKNPRLRARIIFYSLMMLLPMLQVAIFYVFVNINSFIMAFQEYTTVDGVVGYVSSFAGFKNFASSWEIVTTCWYMVENSLVMFVINVIVGITLSLVFSFYLYKQYMFAGFFKVILFMPQIISNLIFALLFKYIVTDVYIYFAMQAGAEGEILGLLSNPDTRMATIYFYNIWISFGVKTLMFSGAMSGIDESLVESAHLDGANLVQEFMHVSVPLIYPTLVQFLIISITSIFTNQMGIVSLYGMNGNHVGSLGYFLYAAANRADYVKITSYYTYGELSAFGLLLTAVLLPLTIITRKVLEKFGPSAD